MIASVRRQKGVVRDECDGRLDKAVYRVRHRKYRFKAAVRSQSQPQNSFTRLSILLTEWARHAPACSDGTGHPREQIGRQALTQPRAARVVSALMQPCSQSNCRRLLCYEVAHDRRAERPPSLLTARGHVLAIAAGRQTRGGEGTEGAACAIMSCDNGIPFVCDGLQ